MRPDVLIVAGILIGGLLTCALLMTREDWRQLRHDLRLAPRWWWASLGRQRVRVRIAWAGRTRSAPETPCVAERRDPLRPFHLPAAKGLSDHTVRDHQHTVVALRMRKDS